MILGIFLIFFGIIIIIAAIIALKIEGEENEI